MVRYLFIMVANKYPLVVDLDGTLVKSDLLIETWLSLLRHKPLSAIRTLLSLSRGRACFKREVARLAAVDVDTLPYHRELLNYLRAEHDAGRRIVLASAGDAGIVHAVADHLGIFDQVMASDGVTNLAGVSKRDRLLKEFGAKAYDYAGNAAVDLPVWAQARRAILVEPSRGLPEALGSGTEIERTFTSARGGLSNILRALRLHQWAKNLLVFIPLLASHRSVEIALLGLALVAFIGFGLCASASYVVNDLLDLESDRRHPDKRLRPFACGDLSVVQGLLLAPPLAVAGLVLGYLVAPLLAATLALYLIATLFYSLIAKHVALLDVLWLASLYTLRLIAGAAAVAVWPSEWLMVFSMFLFLSLALVKRYTELVTTAASGEAVTDRGYRYEDRELLATLGVASGYLSVMVSGLYINSAAARLFYRTPDLLWGACIMLLYWISHMWFVTHRRRMSSDPVAFALRDRASWIVFIVSAAFLLAAT